ncbi:MAG: DUF7133 domain-containing protein [Roseibacillus sp.]
MRTFFLLLLSSVTLLGVDKEKPPAPSLLSFEGDGFKDWQLEGDAFGVGPCTELPEEINGVARGYCKESFGCSAVGGVAATGTLTSPEFKLSKPFLSFKIGGSSDAVGVELLVGDQVVKNSNPQAGLDLKRVTWPVKQWQGKKVRIRCYDYSETGFLLIDHLLEHPGANPLFPNSTREGKAFEPGLKSSPLLPGLIIPEGTTATIFADHKTHSVTSPTALTIAEDGTLFLSESNRFRHGVEDNRDNLYWLLDDIASRSPDDRRLLHQKWQHEVPLKKLTEKSEVVRRLRDNDNDGSADESTIFADEFNDLLDGTAAGVFAYEDVIYFACIPNIWALSDLNNDGKVSGDERLIIQDGFGVRVSLSGHDLNGFTLGPDGRIYGTMGDRGMNLTTAEGSHYPLADQGAAFRFEPDGSGFEIFHTGLRNPKEIAFNEVGDAFSVDNNADLGDLARLVYLVEGADSGWRTDHQTLNTFHRQVGLENVPPSRWMTDRMWDLANPKQPAWMLPPIAHFSNGPSGLAFQPGTALGGKFENHFFVCDYKGGPSASGVHAFSVQPHEASYQLTKREKFTWGLGATDIDFGFQGTTYLTDFVTGWVSAQQGRVIALNPDEHHPQAAEVAQIMSEGFRQRNEEELMTLLSHPDQRIRLRAQVALSEKPKALSSFYSQLHLRNELLDLPPENLLLPPLDFDDELRDDNTPVARLHATWGLAMLARKNKDPYATAALIGLLKSPDPELRAQAAKALGEAPVKDATRLIEALTDSSERVRFFAALSLGRLRVKEAFEPLLTLALHAGDRNDPYLRHAAVVGLTGCASEQELVTLSGHALPAMRLPTLLALHRLRHTGVNRFLFDHTPGIRHEAIRIIHDTPIEAARPALIAVVDELLQKEDSQVPPFIWRRLIHSTFRLSGEKNAARLLTIANTPKVPLAERKEALRLLRQWTQPFPVDQSLGRHAPLGPRPLSDIRPLLEGQLMPFLHPDSPVLNEAIALLAHYEISPTNLNTDNLLGLVQNKKIPNEARSIALKLLANDDTFVITPLLIKILDKDAIPTPLTLDALTLLTAHQPEASFPYLSQALHAKNPALRQGAALQLATHPHPEVPLLLVAYFDRLREKENPDHSIELEMTLAAKVSTHHAAHDALKAYQDSLADDPLAPFIASLHGGNAAKGAALFASHPAAQCARCHASDPKINADGMAGPHLSDIGNQPPRYLLEALVQPSATIAPGFSPITLTLNNGEILAGTLLYEKPEHIDLLVKGKALRVLREDLDTASQPLSPMPAMHQLLPSEEIRDVVAYLSSLKIAPSNKKPLAQEPKRYHPSSAPNQIDMAEETTPTPAPAENASATPAAAGVPEGIDPAVWELGKAQYMTCAACHGPEGAGVPNLGPPFAKSEWVTGPVENLVRIQLRGLTGPITVNKVDYPAGVMGPLSFQTDEQIAAVLTYVRNSFGNSASAVTPEMVAAHRDEVGQPMLTVADLIDPLTAVAETATTELAPAVIGDLPKGNIYNTFPMAILAIIFLLIVAGATGKLLFGKS